MATNECKGCALRVQFGHRKECKLTKPNVKDIKDCPCKECLIKMSCTLLCSKFVKVFKKSIKGQNWVFTPKVNTPRPGIKTFFIERRGS